MITLSLEEAWLDVLLLNDSQLMVQSVCWFWRQGDQTTELLSFAFPLVSCACFEAFMTGSSKRVAKRTATEETSFFSVAR